MKKIVCFSAFIISLLITPFIYAGDFDGWRVMPIRSEEEYNQGAIGGEGMQHPHGIAMKMEYKNNGLIINKAFMSKNNALKIQYNKNLNQIYIHAGRKDNDKWIWIKTKFSDTEIGDILRVLDEQTEKCSFYHQFNGNTTRTWINKKDGFVFFKIEDISKALNSGEQEVMKILLIKIVALLNIEEIR